MKLRRSLLFPLILFCLSVHSRAQNWSGILLPTYGTGACTVAPTDLPAQCGISWSSVGVTYGGGGIPARTTICSTINASACGNGASDCTSTIQNALNSCASGDAVLLGAGTFLVNTHLTVPSNVTLRGSGASSTIINAMGSGAQGAINLGTGSPNYSSGVSITSGATAGSTSIVVSSASGLSAGMYLLINDLNDSYVSIAGGEGNCTYCDYNWSGTRARSQMVEISKVSGTTITFNPPLYTSYAKTPLATPMTATKYAGVENLQLYSNNTGYTTGMFQMSACAYCWLKGVEGNYTDSGATFVLVYWGFKDEIRDSYFSNAYSHGAGVDTSLFLALSTSASLVENNIIERSHDCIFSQWGNAGNVIAYNYCNGFYTTGTPNFSDEGIQAHGPHPQFDLIEGNVLANYTADEIHGSSSHNTLFRNWTQGVQLACNPNTDTRGSAPVCTPVGVNGTGSVNGWYPYEFTAGIRIDHLSWYFNLVGNVVGSANQNTLFGSGNNTAILAWTSAACGSSGCRSYASIGYNMTFGFGEANDTGAGVTGCTSTTCGCDGSTNPPCHSVDAYETAFLHGNYTNADGNIIWASSVTHTLPASFYLSGKPAWWGSLSFPAIGPDVTGGTGPGGHTSLTASNPAQNCYLNVMGGVEGGTGSPLTFNAGTCYGNPPPQPAPPTGLRVTVQ